MKKLIWVRDEQGHNHLFGCIKQKAEDFCLWVEEAQNSGDMSKLIDVKDKLRQLLLQYHQWDSQERANVSI